MSWVHLAGSIPCLNILLIIFIAHLQVVNSHKPLKALFYSPTYGHSHLRFIGALAETFADAGHTAHLLIPEWYPSLKENGTTAIKRIIRIEPSFPSQYPKIEFFKKPFMKEEDMRGWHFFENTSVQFCKDLLSNEKLLNELRDEHYDIGYAELIEYCPFGIFRLIKVKSMAIVSALPLIDTIVEAWGIPSPPSYVTDSLQSHVNAPFLSYWQRFLSLVTTFTKRRLFRHLLDAEDKLYKEMIGNEFPNLRDIIQNASVAFINTPPLVEIPRPLSPKIINIGGLVSRLSRKKVLKSGVNMTLPKSDTVLFSLGSITNTSAMPSIMIEAMKEMVTRFPKIHFILKMTTADSEKHFANFPNVQIFEWIDQIALLENPSTKVFITHVGVNSLMEAISAGKPMICIPLFGDQKYNTAMLLRLGVAIYVDKTSLTKNVLADKLEEILNNPRYTENIKRLKRKLDLYPFQPDELFVKWSEYSAEFGTFPETTLHGANMNFFTYFSLDVIIPCIFLVFVVSCIILKLFVVITRKIRSRKTKIE